MAKITISDLSGGFASIDALNAAFQDLEDELNDKVLYRDNPEGEANQMENDLDMNGNNILNVSSYDVNTLRAGNLYINGTLVVPSSVATSTLPDQTGHTAKFIQTDGVSASWQVPGAAEVSFTPSGTGAVATTVQNKLRESVSVKDFGAVGDGVTDDTAAIQAAITYAESLSDVLGATDVKRGKVIVDLVGGLYGLSDTLLVTRQISIRNGSFVALSAPITTTFMMKITGERASIEDVDFDGGLSGSTRYADLVWIDGPRVSVSRLQGIHFPNYGIRITVNAQENSLEDVSLREWQFDEAGTADGTLRTAKALSVEDADNIFVNVICAQSKYPLYLSGPANLFSSCHFYNGGSLTTTEDISAYIDNTQSNMFVGTYFDNGSLYIKDNFKNSISGCLFLKTASGTNSQAIYLNSSAVSEAVNGLVVTGSLFSGTLSLGPIVFGGSGTYATDIFKALYWIGNTNTTGAVAWKYEKTGAHSYKEYGYEYLAPSGSFYNVMSLKGIRLSADYNANSEPDDSTIALATEGTDRWIMNAIGQLLPTSSNTYSVGDTTAYLTKTTQGKVQVVDGIAEPATVAGFAWIYVDSIDGDLKVKFGDGVVKTIATDV